MYKIRVFFKIFLVFVLQFVFVGSIYAAEVSLSPSEGDIYSEPTPIDIQINPEGEIFNGMSIYLSYDGPVEFLGIDNGEINGCEVESLDPTDSTKDSDIILFCLVFGSGYSGSTATFATLNFKAIGEGPTSIEINEVDIAPLTAQTFGGSYIATLSEGSHSIVTDDSYWEDDWEDDWGDDVVTETEEDLPDASIFAYSVTIGGLLLVSFSYILLKSEDKRACFFRNSSSSSKMSDKID